VHTMCTPWGTHVPWRHLLTLTPSRLFPILLDPKSFQTALDFITWLPGHVLSIHCRLIITILTMSLAKVCLHSRLITYYIYTDGSWSVLTINNPILDVVFPASSSISCYVICYVTTVTFLFIVQKEEKKRKKKKNQIKENR